MHDEEIHVPLIGKFNIISIKNAYVTVNLVRLWTITNRYLVPRFLYRSVANDKLS